MLRLILISLIFSSCHIFLDEKLPDRSINFHEQLADGAEGYLKDLVNLGNSEFTILSSAPPAAFFKKGEFKDFQKNEEYLFKLANERGPSLKVICTLNPNPQSDAVLKELEQCLSKKALGVKSYHLHGPIAAKFQSGDPISYETYRKIFKLLESRRKIFFLLSNNKEKVQNILNIAKEFRHLPVYCPNFCFMANQLDKLEQLLKEFPNLIIGYSFLYPKVFYKFLRKQKLQQVKDFFLKHQDRIFYESSLILDANEIMSDRYLYWNLKNQYSYLKFPIFSYFSPPVIKKAQNFPGLGLSDKIIDKIFYSNASGLLNSLSNSR